MTFFFLNNNVPKVKTFRLFVSQIGQTRSTWSSFSVIGQIFFSKRSIHPQNGGFWSKFNLKINQRLDECILFMNQSIDRSIDSMNCESDTIIINWWIAAIQVKGTTEEEDIDHNFENKHCKINIITIIITCNQQKKKGKECSPCLIPYHHVWM